jgi:AcrR family transcriptional regulator
MLKVRPRRIGRPDAQATEELNRRLLRTATRLFIHQGYAATSMEQVAAAARVGKQTIYRRYASKEVLFASVLGEMTKGLLLASTAQVQASDPLVELRETWRTALEFASRPTAVALYRILIAEALRFPKLVERAAETALDPFSEKCRRLICDARGSGQLRNDCSVEDMAQAISGMINGWLIDYALLGRRGPSGKTERRAFFDVAWRLFLEGAAPGRRST